MRAKVREVARHCRGISKPHHYLRYHARARGSDDAQARREACTGEALTDEEREPLLLQLLDLPCLPSLRSAAIRSHHREVEEAAALHILVGDPLPPLAALDAIGPAFDIGILWKEWAGWRVWLGNGCR